MGDKDTVDFYASGYSKLLITGICWFECYHGANWLIPEGYREVREHWIHEMHARQWLFPWFIKHFTNGCHLLLFAKQPNRFCCIKRSIDKAGAVCEGQRVHHSLWFCLCHVYLRWQSTIYIWNPRSKRGELSCVTKFFKYLSLYFGFVFVDNFLITS